VFHPFLLVWIPIDAVWCHLPVALLTLSATDVTRDD